MKKLLLSLGAIASVAAPVAAVVACGSTTPDAKPTATLADLKKIDIAAARQIAKTQKIPDDQLNVLIGQINDAKTVDELTAIMADVNHVPNNGGSTDNSGDTGPVTTTVTGGATGTSGDSFDVATYKTQQLGSLAKLTLTPEQRQKATEGINAATDKAGVDAAYRPANSASNLANTLPTASAKATLTGTVVSVDVILGKDDFKNHVDAEIAQAIFKELETDFNDKAKTLTKIEVKVSDGTTTVTKSKDIVIASTSTPAHTNTVINNAIDSVSEEVAEEGTLKRDIAMNAADYETLMVARLKKVTVGEMALNKANKILEAVGNASRFTSATEVKTVFGGTITFNGTTEAELTKLLTPFFDLETKDHPAVADALTALYSTFTA